MSKETFTSLVAAVEENNRINGGSWQDWDDAKHIQDAYGELYADCRDVAEKFLNAMIRDNGDNYQAYKDALDYLQYGVAFTSNK